MGPSSYLCKNKHILEAVKITLAAEAKGGSLNAQMTAEGQAYTKMVRQLRHTVRAAYRHVMNMTAQIGRRALKPSI
jgi:hypothetical protein